MSGCAGPGVAILLTVYSRRRLNGATLIKNGVATALRSAPRAARRRGGRYLNEVAGGCR